MTCTITRPDPQELFNRLKTMFSAHVLGGSEIVPESNEWYVISLDYALHEEFYSISEQQWKERDPRYACCDNLIKLAEVDGVYPKAAGFAEGYVRITGTPNALLGGGLEVVFGEKNYRSTGTVPGRLNAQGVAVVRFRAVESGEDSNQNSTTVTTGQLVTTLTGIDKTVTIFGGQFCGGTAKEDCETFRRRYLARKQYQPRATDAWLQQKLLEWPCVTRVCKRAGNCCEIDDECACLDCGSKIQYYVFFDNTFDCGLAPQCVIDEITAWLFGDPQGYGLGQVEIGVCGSLHTATAAPIDILIDGLACVTPAQQTEIEERIRDLFRTICPSDVFYRRQVETVIAQVVGSASDFDVVFSSNSTGITFTSCGDIDPSCDVMPCFNTITYAYTQSSFGSCAE